MESFEQKLNDVLISAYRNILCLEEQALVKTGNIDLSINEMHLIECVGKGQKEGITIRALAEALQIKSPSVTVAVQKLVKKGCLIKEACKQDARAVRVLLSKAGRRVNAYHHYYHRMMVAALAKGMTEEEKSVLLRSVHKLNNHFVASLDGPDAV